MEEIGLVDIYRLRHPKTKQFTYESKPLRLKSRIDFFLITSSLAAATKRCEIRPSIAPDHKAIFLGIELKSEVIRGLGTWKFNNSLLEDENYVILINFITLKYWKSIKKWRINNSYGNLLKFKFVVGL